MNSNADFAKVMNSNAIVPVSILIKETNTIAKAINSTAKTCEQ